MVQQYTFTAALFIFVSNFIHMYTTKYGDQIEDKYFSKLNRFDIKSSILRLFEMDLIKSTGPGYSEFGDSVDNLDHGGKSCGSIIPRSRWQSMMHIMSFQEGSSSTEGWKTWTAGGLSNTKTSQSSIAYITVLEDYQWEKRMIGNSVTINYRKKDGNFFIYNGNIEDLYSQICYHMRTAFHAKVAEKFGI